jgi:NAD(P)-dependent dehydrogenase (short-subunit alcohol dehydrogenase family)
MATKKVALVTGANKGLGLEIARQLAQQGITVVTGARDEEKARTAADQLKGEGLDVYPVKLDVTNAEDIANLPKLFQEHFGQLDILVNNAGANYDFEGDVTADTLRRMYETNVIGPFAITKALLPLLKASPAGRIVNQSSMLGSLALMSKGQGGAFMTPGYTTSKAALNMLTVVTAQELKGTNVKVNAAHPGWVQTDMGGKNAPLSVEEGAKTAVALATLDENGPTGAFLHKGKPLPW